MRLEYCTFFQSLRGANHAPVHQIKTVHRGDSSTPQAAITHSRCVTVSIFVIHFRQFILFLDYALSSSAFVVNF